ncbi:MAG: flagellar biosynthesis protein FlhB [Methylococcaceae bacterium]|nr:MAG: flagellar biosynthesis protein FlhB [Methylococcaceae bacterium]
MAEETEKEERTEDPTERRLEQARERGQIARSREFNTAVSLTVAAWVLWVFGNHFVDGVARLMRQEFRLQRDDFFYPEAILRHLNNDAWEMAKLFGPYLLLLMLVALAAPIGVGGWNFSEEAMDPKFDRINPLNGLKRMFAVHGLIELGKSLLKVLLISVTTWLLLRHYWVALLGLSAEPLLPALAHASDIMGYSLLILCLSLSLIAAIDVPVQLWEHHKNLRMTRQEVKDEMKDTEGRPEVKGRIRQMQMEIAMRRMMEEVPKADVVITNPTHYAVALKYEAGGKGAPRLVAKGADLMAAQIRNVANSANVPLLSAPPLARALYHSTELNQEIPAGLYLAVAQVLAYVYQLRTARQFGGDIPPEPSDLPIPPDLAREE